MSDFDPDNFELTAAEPGPEPPASPLRVSNRGQFDPGKFDLQEQPAALVLPKEAEQSPFRDQVPATVRGMAPEQGFDTEVALSGGDIRNALVYWKGLNPDKAAQVLRHARERNVGYHGAEVAGEEYQIDDETKQIFEDLNKTGDDGQPLYPNTAKFLKDPMRLHASRDDLGALRQVEDLIRRREQKGEGRMMQRGRDLLAAVPQIADGILTIFPAFVDLAGESAVAEQREIQILEAAHKEFGDFDIFNLTEAQGERLSQLRKEIKPPPIETPEWAQNVFGLKDFAHNAAEAVRSIPVQSPSAAFKEDGFGAAVAAVPDYAMQAFAPTAAAAGVGFITKNPTLALSLLAGMSGGQGYEEARSEGKGATMSLGQGLAYGAAEYYFEKLGTFGIFDDATKLAKRDLKSLSGFAAHSLFRGAFSEGATTAAQQTADYFAGDPHAYDNFAADVIDASLAGGFGDATVTVPAGVAMAMMSSAKQTQATRSAQWLDEVMQKSATSKLAQRDAGTFETVVAGDLQEAGQPERLFIGADKVAALFQEKEEFLKFTDDVGVSRAVAQVAFENGSDLEIETAKYVAKYSKDAIASKLRDDLRFSEDALSVNESNLEQARMRDALTAVASDLQKLAPDAPMPQRVKSMREALLGFKGDKGQTFKAKDVDAMLQLVMARAKMSADARGISTEQWFDDWGLNIDTASAVHKDAAGNWVISNGSADTSLFQGAEPGLVALHNVSTDKMLHALKMGGLPVPSLAITRSDIGFDSFGEITLVASPEMVTPSRDTKVLDADAYSPRYPTVHYEMTKEDLKKLRDFFASTKEGFPNLSTAWSWSIGGAVDNVSEKGVRYSLENSPLTRLEYAKEKKLLPEGFEKLGQYEADDALRQSFDKFGDEYQNWVTALIEKLDLKPVEKIFNGFTNAGKRRYLAYNLDTVVKLMKKGFRDAEGFNYGGGSVRAVAAKQFRTVAQIQKERNRFVTSEQMEALKEEINNELTALADKAMAFRANPINGFGKYDAFSDDLKALAQGQISYLREQYPNGEPLPEMRAFLEKLRNAPTQYFEAKLRRAVGVHEFAGAVVPEGTKPAVLAELKRRGIQVAFYKKGDRAGRTAAVQQLASAVKVLFQSSIDSDAQGATMPTDEQTRQDAESKRVSTALRSTAKDIRAGGQSLGADAGTQSDARAVVEEYAIRNLVEAGQLEKIKWPEKVFAHGFEHVVTKVPGEKMRVRKFTHNDNGIPAGWRVDLISAQIKGAQTQFAIPAVASPSEYLERVAVFNEVFGDDMKLVGAAERPDGTWGLVTEQRLLEGSEPTKPELDAYMDSKGFSKAFDDGRASSWHRADGVWAADVKPDNFVKTEGGIFAIDVVTARDKTLFQNVGEPKGAIRVKKGNTVVNLFAAADYSTFLHESAHLFVADLEDLVANGMGGEQVARDLQTLRDFVGNKDGSDFTKEQNEDLARAFENYLREGKAPSVGLSDVFFRFKSWLMALYRSALVIGAPLNDNVRAVFDRMLAAEEDILAAELYYGRKQNFADILASTEQEKIALEAKAAKFKKSALEKQTAIYLKAYFRAIGGEKEFAAEIRRQVENTPLRKAMAKMESGVDHLTVEQFADPTTAAALKKKYPEIFDGYGVNSLDAVASEFGFLDPADLAAQWLGAPALDDAVAAETAKQRNQLEATLRADLAKQGPTEADGVLHDADSLEYLIAETQVLRNKAAKANVMSSSRISREAIKAAAHEYLVTLPVTQATNFSRFIQSERRLAGETLAAAAKGDWEEATKLRDKQLLQHALVRESMNARTERRAIERRYMPSKVSALLKKTEFAYRAPIEALLVNYGFKEGLEGDPFDMSQLPQLDEDGTLAALIPDWIKNSEKTGDYKKTLSWGELLEVDGAIQRIAAYGRDAMLSLTGEQDKTITEFVTSSTERMDGLKDFRAAQKGTWAYPVLESADWLKSHVTMTQFLSDIADGFEFLKKGLTGPMRRLYQRLLTAELQQNNLQKGVMDLATPHWKVLRGAVERIESLNGKYFDIPGLPLPREMTKAGKGKWTGEMVVSAMLNSGNTGNFEALKNGYQLQDGFEQVLGKFFTVAELKAIQGIWDVTDTLWPELDQAHFKVYNEKLTKVEGRPIMFESLEGPYELAGGYYPLIFDHEVNARAGFYNEQDLMKNRASAVFRKTKPKDGMTISRVGTALPPDLTLDVWATHIQDTARNISHTAVVRDWNRVTTNELWREKFTDKFGNRQHTTLRDWLKYQAVPRRFQTGPVTRGADKIADWLRARSSFAILGLKLKSGLLQRTALINSAVALGGWKWIGEGYKTLGTKAMGTTMLGLSNNETWAKIAKDSHYMAQRERTIDREIRDAVEQIKPGARTYKIGGREFTLNDIRDFSFEWLRMNDRSVVAVVWSGAYQKYVQTLSEQTDTTEAQHKKAIAYADSMVQDTQPSSLKAELSSFQRTEGWVRFFTAFMSWSFKYGNRILYYGKAWNEGAIDNKTYFNHLAHEVFAEPWFRLLMRSAMVGSLPPLWMLLMAPFETLLSWIPILRDIPRALTAKQPGFDLDKAIPASEGFKRAGKVVKSTGDLISGDGDFTKFATDLGQLTTYIIGVPVDNVVKDIKSAYDTLFSDEEKTP